MNRYFEKYSKESSLYFIGPFYQKQDYAEPVVFIDRGNTFRKSCEGIAIGDGDSSEGKLDILLNPEKNFSDFSYALHLVPNQFNQIICYGFLGGRKDHELINIGESHRFLKNKIATSVNFDNKIKGLSPGTWNLEVKGTFSLYSFEDCEITLTGDCKYPLAGRNLLPANSSLGLSNEGYGDIHIIAESPLFIFFT